MTLKHFILHQLCEMQRKMLIAVAEDLSDEQLTTIAPGHTIHIAWMVQHCCLNVDRWLHQNMTGQMALTHDQRFLDRPTPPPEPDERFPSSRELRERWQQVTDKALAALTDLDEAALQEPGPGLRKEPLVESCLRVINHQNAHLRQIWITLAVLGITAIRWPEQGKWLANIAA